jgi:hypothetical protein
MSELNDLFRETDAELKAYRDSKSTKETQAKVDAELLKSLVATEWPALIARLHALTEDELVDGKKFFWNDRSVMLGLVTLTVWELQFRFSKYGEELCTPTAMRPEISGETLLWSCGGVSLGKDRSTSATAKALILKLVAEYKATQMV